MAKVQLGKELSDQDTNDIVTFLGSYLPAFRPSAWRRHPFDEMTRMGLF